MSPDLISLVLRYSAHVNTVQMNCESPVDLLEILEGRASCVWTGLTMAVSAHHGKAKGSRLAGAHFKGNVLPLPIAVKPQHQPLALPGLLLQIALHLLLVLEQPQAACHWALQH